MVEEKNTEVIQRQNIELKNSLTELQESYETLRDECHFHQVKVSELTEIVTLKTKDEIHEKLLSKSLQHAELSTQVDKLKMELNQASASVQKLGGQREENKRMLLELSDIVRTLKSVKVDYRPSPSKNSYLTPQEMSLKNVKRKVETIMEDRRLLVARCKDLEKENKQKQEKITALEGQFHLLNSSNIANGTPSLLQVATNRSIRSQMSIDSNSASQKPVEDDTDSQSSRQSFHADATKPKKTSSIDESTVVSGSTSPASETEASSCASSVQVNNVASDADESEEEIQRLKAELVQANSKYSQFKDVCQRAFTKMRDIEHELTQAKTALNNTSYKRDEYKENLRDVITQYKQLHQEHEESVADIEFMKEKIMELEEEKTANEERASEIMEAEGLSDNVDDLISAYRRAGEKIASLERKVAAAKREVESTEKRRTQSSRMLRDAVANCCKLEREKEHLEKRVSEAEKNSKLSRKEALLQKEEAKHTRRRLTLYMRSGVADKPSSEIQYEHEYEFEEEGEDEFEDEYDGDSRRPWTDEMLRRMMLIEASVVGKEWNARHEILRERDRLEDENNELKAFCEEMLSGSCFEEEE